MPDAIGSHATAHQRPARWWAFLLPRPWLALLAAALIAALAYWPGLSGPLLLDDLPNLAPIGQWIQGDAGWQGVVFDNRSGPLGRPLSMLSLLANAGLAGDSVFGLKLGNLLLHLLAGALVYLLVERLLRRDRRWSGQARWIAAAAAALWLLHPLHVSTVLYVIQRMAQVSALFSLGAVLCYLVGRERLDAGRTVAGRVLLFLAFPLAAALAVLGKENGAVAPLLCLAVELGYPASRAQWRREIGAFHAMFLVFPALVLAGAVAAGRFDPFEMYAMRDFSLWERLLSQPRALADYLLALLLPDSTRLGIYTDDFVTSRGLLQPPGTVLALAFWAAVAALAVLLRRRAPAIATGIAFFLAAHAVESTVLPLELYFEHRNYLPSVGVLLCVVVAAFALAGRLAAGGHARAGAWILAALAVLVLVDAAATAARSRVWQSRQTLVAQALQTHPASRRARLEQVTIDFRSGRYAQAADAIARLREEGDASQRAVADVHALVIGCVSGNVDAATLDRLDAIAVPRLNLDHLQAIETLKDFVLLDRCPGIEPGRLARSVRALLDRSPQPERLLVKWRLRVRAGELFAAAGQHADALAQLDRAWSTGRADPQTSGLMIHLLLMRGDLARARDVLREAADRVPAHDRRGREQIAALGRRIDEAGRTPGEALP
ncbi:MAG TPA: hypothetical protein VFG21_05330 [Xanthomonadaceae bacterium]|nr:hypothetical protein [Xanthomonadaceae bacterium]